MISLLVNQLFISYTCLLSGILFYSLWRKGKETNPSPNKNIIFYFITGLICITAIGQGLALFMPVALPVAVFLLLVLQGCVLMKGSFFKSTLLCFFKTLMGLHPLTKGGIAITWLFLLLLNSGPTLMDDTESYHIQMVKWIHQYGTVPGIANVHERFGFNSSWFTSIAVFSFPTTYNFYTVLNGTLSVWFSLYLWMNADALFKLTNISRAPTKEFISLLIFTVCLLAWPLIRGNASTANYDIITAVIVFVLFIESIHAEKEVSSFPFEAEWMVWPVYLFTVRIINFPLLLLPLSLSVLYLNKKHWKPIYFYSAFSLVLVLPFLMRTFLLSGFFFYPSPFADFFYVDWKVDKKVVNDLLYYIKYFNRVNPMFQPIQETATLHGLQWIPYWYRYLFIYDKLIVIPGLCGYLLFIMWKRKAIWQHPFLLIFLTALVLQLALWFCIAPDPRFAYGCFLCGFALLLFPFAAFLKSSFLKSSAYAITVGVFIFLAGLGIKKFILEAQHQNVIYPFLLPQPPVTKIKVNNIDINIPARILDNWNPRCYATDLPCGYRIDKRLQLRGPKLSDGFMIRKN